MVIFRSSSHPANCDTLPAMEDTETQIYLDYAATTPCRPEVIEVMLPWLGARAGNTANSSHRFGRNAATAVEQARQHLATLAGGVPEQFIFTGSATEALTTVIRGLAEAVRSGNTSPGIGKLGSDADTRSARRSIIVSAIEHRAVLLPVEALARDGFEIHHAPVDANGLVDLAKWKLTRPMGVKRLASEAPELR